MLNVVRHSQIIGWIEVDKVICVMMPENLYALALPAAGIGIWYENFEQRTDAQVCELLTRRKLTTSNS